MPHDDTSPGADRPVIVVDGTESVAGRALFTISALYWCRAWLPGVDLRLIDVANPNVLLAAEAFSWEHGISFDIRHADPARDGECPLDGADLYAAVVFRSARHLRLEQARMRAIPMLLAIQFPEPEWFAASTLLRSEAAFDPRVFACDLECVIRPWV